MGIVTDPYSFTNGTVADALQVNARVQAILAQLNGNVDETNIASALLQRLGLNGGTIGRGKSIVATTEARTNVAYGLMPTPDRVSGLVLPTDGLIFVAYQATWQESVAQAARAAIFIGASQLTVKQLDGPSAAVTQAAATSAGTAARDMPLFSFGQGLGSSGNSSVGGTGADATTGQAVGVQGNTGVMMENNGAVITAIPSPNMTGGPCVIFAAAGTYDVSVQFKASSGSVTAKNRRLWVWTVGF